MLITRVLLKGGGIGCKCLGPPYEHATIFDCFTAYCRRDTSNRIGEFLATGTAAVDQFACCIEWIVTQQAHPRISHVASIATRVWQFGFQSKQSRKQLFTRRRSSHIIQENRMVTSQIEARPPITALVYTFVPSQMPSKMMRWR